jgi:hypothetical protein
MRKIGIASLVVVLVALGSWGQPRRAESITTSIFPLSISGKSWQPGVVAPPGRCAGCGKIKDKAVTAVLQGTLDDFAKDYLPLDPSGKVFLYYDSRTDWRVATNVNGQDTVPLSGHVANDGTFWMMGDYNMGTMGSMFAVGKVKFDKRAADPFQAKSVKGTFYFFSELIDTGLVLKFKTGKPVL